jgi:hypothetical protein
VKNRIQALNIAIHECKKFYGYDFDRMPPFFERTDQQWTVRFGSRSDDDGGAFVATVDVKTGKGKGCAIHTLTVHEPSQAFIEKWMKDHPPKN